jgi:hypothetical protein
VIFIGRRVSSWEVAVVKEGKRLNVQLRIQHEQCCHIFLIYMMFSYILPRYELKYINFNQIKIKLTNPNIL